VRAVQGGLALARDRGLDPEWPPVLIALFVVLVGVVAVSVFVVFRALRSEARRDGRRRPTNGAGPR
jgi:hypothetical protein